MNQRLAAALTGRSAVDAPGEGQPTVVVNGDLAGFEEAITHSNAVATAIEAGPTRVRDGLIDIDSQGEVTLQELIGHVGEAGPQGMSVRAVAKWFAWNAAKPDLVQLEPFSLLVVARIHEVRTVRESSRAHEIRVALAQQAAEDVEDAAQRVGAAGQGGRFTRLEQGAFGDVNLHQVIETVVEQDLRVENHDHVDPGEHLEHFFVEEKVHRADGLWVGSLEVEMHGVALAPHGAGDLVRAHAHAVIADVILEILAFFGHRVEDQLAHRFLVAVQQIFQRGVVNVVAEAPGNLHAALFRCAAGSDDRVEIRPVPVRQSAVVQDDLEHVLLQFSVAVHLDRGHQDAFFIDVPGIGR